MRSDNRHQHQDKSDSELMRQHVVTATEKILQQISAIPLNQKTRTFQSEKREIMEENISKLEKEKIKT